MGLGAAVSACMGMSASVHAAGFHPSMALPLPCTTAAPSVPYPVVDTGQVQCYGDANRITCPAAGADFYGQDAQIKGKWQAALTVSADGLTVSDVITGLTWPRSADTNGDGAVTTSDKLVWDTAASFCEGFQLAGEHGILFDCLHMLTANCLARECSSSGQSVYTAPYLEPLWERPLEVPWSEHGSPQEPSSSAQPATACSLSHPQATATGACRQSRSSTLSLTSQVSRHTLV